LDLPGHGKSEGPGEQAIPAYADHLDNWMRALGLARAVLVGQSMGGAIAMTMALQHPSKVIGLGLVGTGARLRVHPQILENAANPISVRVATDLILSKSFHPETESRLIELAGIRFNEVRPSVLHGDLLACDMFDLRAEIPAITCPTLVLCGDQDEMTPLRYSQYLARSIPDASLTVIPAAGHMVALEQPKATAESLQGFLANLESSLSP
jgi:pimeloyl-ACP methyl ester carboxylesterase